MPKALKATWGVRAGVIPGEAMGEYSKQFFYTSDDYEEDAKHRELNYLPIFCQKMAEAQAYMQQLNNPKFLNWVEMTFMWL